MYLNENLFSHQTSINSSALLVSLMALYLTYVDQKTFWPCFTDMLSQPFFINILCKFGEDIILMNEI